MVTPLPGDEAYLGRLVIPYLTRGGVVNIKYRCSEEHICKDHGHVKYLGLPGHAGKPRLYGVHAFFAPSRVIAVTEGELDALVATEYVGIPTVGCPGVSAWQPHYPRCFASYELVVVFADGDKPGRDFARMVAKQDRLPRVRVVELDDGMDVNSTYLTEGADGLKRRAGL